MGDGLRRSATNFPAKVAAKDRFREVTYGELNDRVNRLANGLLSLGIGRGDDVAVLVGNRIEHLEIIFATAKIGALAIPLDIKWKALELGSVLAFFKPKALILQPDCLEAFEEARAAHDLTCLKSVVLCDLSYGGLLNGQSTAEPPVAVHEDDAFAVLLTSGTTGFPKGVMLTHYGILNNGFGVSANTPFADSTVELPEDEVFSLYSLNAKKL